MKRIINACILPVSLIGFYIGCYYVLKSLDVPIWLYRGLASICISVLLSIVVGCVWLDICGIISCDDDSDLNESKKNEEPKIVSKIYGSDE